MSLKDQMAWSIKMSKMHWHHIADECPLDGIAGSKFQSTEGNDNWGNAGRALDMAHGIDAFAVAGSTWTPVSSRVQDGIKYDYQTITIRVAGKNGGSSEWGRYWRPDGDDPILARYVSQIYTYNDEFGHAVVVEVESLRRHIRSYGPDGEGLRLLVNGADGVPFAAFGASELINAGVVAWSSIALVGDDWPICSVCNGGMALGQRGRHWICGPKCARCYMYDCVCSGRQVATAVSQDEHHQPDLLSAMSAR